MADQRDRDDLDREQPLGDDVVGMGDEEFEESEEEGLEDEDELDEDEHITGEVGSEGGSPGENVRTREPRKPAGGSEATETFRK